MIKFKCNSNLFYIQGDYSNLKIDTENSKIKEITPCNTNMKFIGSTVQKEFFSIVRDRYLILENEDRFFDTNMEFIKNISKRDCKTIDRVIESERAECFGHSYFSKRGNYLEDFFSTSGYLNRVEYIEKIRKLLSDNNKCQIDKITVNDFEEITFIFKDLDYFFDEGREFINYINTVINIIKIYNLNINLIFHFTHRNFDFDSIREMCKSSIEI